MTIRVSEIPKPLLIGGILSHMALIALDLYVLPVAWNNTGLVWFGLMNVWLSSFGVSCIYLIKILIAAVKGEL